MNKTVFILAVIIIMATTVTPFLSTAEAITFTYGGSLSGSSDVPGIIFFVNNNSSVSVNNGSVLYSSENLTLFTGISYPSNVQTIMTNMTLVYYQASWLNNQTIVLYNSTLVTPYFLTFAQNGIPIPSSYEIFSYNFTDIPLGPQQIEVTAFGGGLIWGSLRTTHF